MRVYVHYEEAEFTLALTWETIDANNVEKLARKFLDELNKKHGLNLRIEDVNLITNRGKPVKTITHKMDIFVVKKKDEFLEQALKIEQQTENKPKRVKTKEEEEELQKIRLFCAQAAKEAHDAFEKKNYKRSIELFEQLMQIGIDRNGCLSNLGVICLESGLYEKALKYIENSIKYEPENYKYYHRQALAYFGMKKYKEALQAISTSIQLFSVILKNRPENKILQNEMQTLTVLLAKCLYELDDKETAVKLLKSVIKENQEHTDALVEYATHLLKTEEKVGDALNILLSCLVKNQNDKKIRSLIAGIIKERGVSVFKNELKTTKGTAPALAFMALVIKEYGAIDEAIQLYKDAHEDAPDSISYVLNLVHTLEVKLEYQQALEITREYLKRNPDKRVGHVKCKHVYELIEDIQDIRSPTYRFGEEAEKYKNSDYELLWVADKPRLVKKGETYQEEEFPHEEEYDADTLDLLALFYTLVKIFYVCGTLSKIPPLIHLLEPLRWGHELHLTTIRNEHAYYACISQLMCSLAKELPLQEAKPLYVCGDSHCLSPAWRHIQFNNEKRLLIPVLVTGLKCWHLRKESNFYPKVNFYCAIDTIPKKEEVLFMFGEIDCREGILLAVQKCKYESLEEGITHVVDIYLEVLQELEESKQFKIYVHPVLPVLDITRPTVKLFNKILKQKLTEKGKIYLDFFEKLLTEDGEHLQKKYELDGTHIHPDYLTLVEETLQNL